MKRRVPALRHARAGGREAAAGAGRGAEGRGGVKQRLADLSAQAIGSTPAEFVTLLRKEDAKWGEVVRKGDIKLD